MKSNLRVVLCGLLAVLPGLAQQADYPDARSLTAALRSFDPASNQPLPPAWRVRTPDGDYSISTEPLRKLMSSHPEQARVWLRARAVELDRYRLASGATADAGPALRRILADPEFNVRPKPSSLWDRLRQRFDAWIGQLLKRLFGFMGRSPISGAYVFWAAFIGAVGVLAFWLIKQMRSGVTGLNLTGAGRRSYAANPEDWIEAMRKAGNAGDFCKAIQCAYWAGIARLQMSADLPAGSTRTPREYLRHLTTPQPGINPGVPATPIAVDSLRNLTSLLEKFWYGRGAATAHDLYLGIASLKDLGCRLD